jgi:outer membrane biosynthesis protein TonB
MHALAAPSLDLPWTLDPAVEGRFRNILKRVALLALLLGLVMPWLPMPQRDAALPLEVPDRYARLLAERTPPPPPVVAVKPAPEQVVEQPAARPQQVTPPGPRAEAPSAPRPEAPPGPSARERAASTGVMAFAGALADLRSNEAVAAATTTDNLAAGAGEAQRNERNVVTARAGRASDGINTAGMSRDTGGAGLGRHAPTQVSSPVGGGSGGSGGGGGGSVSGGGGDGLSARSREEIELVFDRNKAAIYALYNRALRSDPALRGRLVLELTIAPSGEVTGCTVVSSELSDPEFERRLVARVMMFRFEQKDVATVTTTKPIEFFPA